jgi:hypothetical protein
VSKRRDLDKELDARVEPGGRLLICPLGGVPVQRHPCPTWWTRLLKLSECVSLT